jgi:hypothetical protein
VAEWMDGLSGHDGVHLDRHEGRKSGFETLIRIVYNKTVETDFFGGKYDLIRHFFALLLRVWTTSA